MVRSRHLERLQRQQQTDLEAEFANLASQPNIHYNDRFARLAGRGFLAERGIDTRGLDSTDIPDTIMARQWGRFTSTPPPYHQHLVAEFYAAMVPEVFRAEGSVWVRGVQVEITPAAINAFLETPPAPGSEPYDGMPGDVLEMFDSRAIASSLRRDGAEAWDEDEESMNHGDLHPNLAFWTVFIKCSLIPSTHRTNVSLETAQLLYAIQHGYVFDVGHVIFNQILKHGRELRGNFTFPCLITHFCGLAGIQAAFDVGALQAPKTDICKKAYNHFCTHHGLPNLPTDGRRYRNRGYRAPAQQQQEAQRGVPPRNRAAPHLQPEHDHPDIRERIEEIHSRVIDHGYILHQLQNVIIPPNQQAPPNVYHRRPRNDGAGPSSSRP